MTKNNTLHIIGSISRTLLALTFLFSGFVKAVDPLGTVYKIEDYLKAFGGFWTDLLPLATLAAICLILFEWVMAFVLLFNIRTKWTAWLSFAFYAVMLPLTLYIAIKNPVSDCGCFGDALVISNWATFWKNVVLMALVIILLCCKKYIPQTFSIWTEIIILILAAATCLGLMGYTYRHLPIMDFRPYKVGNNIPQLMEMPEDAEPDQYETTFIYSKDGVEREFTIHDYPKGDSTWTFVDQKSTLVKKGYEPPIHDFMIETMDFDDITYDVLESETPVTLVIMYDLKKTDRKQLKKVAALYRQCMENGEDFYILTGSGNDDVEAFAMEQAQTEEEENPWDNWEIVFCSCDPVTLKTIVRANPGAIVVKDGNIIDKFNIRNKNF